MGEGRQEQAGSHRPQQDELPRGAAPVFHLFDFDDLTGGRAILVDLWEGFAKAAMLVRASASSGIQHRESGACSRAASTSTP